MKFLRFPIYSIVLVLREIQILHFFEIEHSEKTLEIRENPLPSQVKYLQKNISKQLRIRLKTTSKVIFSHL